MARKIDKRDLAPHAFVEPVPPLSGGTVERIAILIPGIRTNAEWITDASKYIETFDVPVEGMRSFGGRISSLHLITRIGLKAIRDDIKAQINKIKIDHPKAELSLVCHSMGTDMICDILDDIDFDFDNVFFIGSVCKAKKANKIRRRCNTFTNHVGVRDPWPILASIVRPDRYGPTGTFGFGRTTYVNDIPFINDHSSCTDINHVSKFILPVIVGQYPLYPVNVEMGFDFNTAHYVRIITYIIIIISIFGSLFISKYIAVAAIIWVVALIYSYMRKDVWLEG